MSYQYGNSGSNPSFMGSVSDILDPGTPTFDKDAHVASPNPTTPQVNSPDWSGASNALVNGGVKGLVKYGEGQAVKAGVTKLIAAL